MALLSELSWPLLPAGNRIRYIWQEWLQNHLENYHGGYLLTLDSLTQCLNMPDNVFDLHLKVGPSLAHHINAEPESLPIAADSIQASIVSFGFDYTETGSVLLGEIHRTLEPQGSLYALLYAPNNPWHLKAKAGLSDSRKQLAAQHIGLGRFKDWLGLLGFEIQECEIIGCPWWRGFSNFQKKSDMSKAWLSAPIAYMIKAQKKVASMSPIKPLDEEMAVAMGGKFANVSTKQSLS
ncbi:MAG: SAM-dependent methyltransferase [Gammaproteobacteria bacterium]|nr:SAM-dependent methyltransferase [Gammaproteobacteria bacterium]